MVAANRPWRQARWSGCHCSCRPAKKSWSIPAPVNMSVGPGTNKLPVNATAAGCGLGGLRTPPPCWAICRAISPRRRCSRSRPAGGHERRHGSGVAAATCALPGPIFPRGSDLPSPDLARVRDEASARRGTGAIYQIWVRRFATVRRGGCTIPSSRSWKVVQAGLRCCAIDDRGRDRGRPRAGQAGPLRLEHRSYREVLNRRWGSMSRCFRRRPAPGGTSQSCTGAEGMDLTRDGWRPADEPPDPAVSGRRAVVFRDRLSGQPGGAGDLNDDGRTAARFELFFQASNWPTDFMN